MFMTKKEFLKYKYKLAYTPEDFGAVGDGVTDDTQAFINLFANCKNIEIPNKTYLVKGFRLFDKVEYNGQIGFIFARRSTGYFEVKTLDGNSISKSVSYKKLKLINTRKSLLIEKR